MNRANLLIAFPIAAFIFAGTGCDNSSPASPSSGPTTRLGKINQLGKDTAKAMSEGGDNKESVTMNATIKIEAAEAKLADLTARAGSSEVGQHAVKNVRDKIEAVKKSLVVLEKSDPGAEPAARAAVRAGLKDIDAAIEKAREDTGG